jgi:hypothetical protein
MTYPPFINTGHFTKPRQVLPTWQHSQQKKKIKTMEAAHQYKSLSSPAFSLNASETPLPNPPTLGTHQSLPPPLV